MWALPLIPTHLKQSRRGFTIVELLIVVVVIAILAAITIVAYNGIQNRAKQSAAQSLVSQVNKKILAHAVQNNDTYPANLDAIGISATDQTKLQYTVNNLSNPKTYGLTGAEGAYSYYTSNTITKPTSGAYQGHGLNGLAAITNLHVNPQLALGTTQFSTQTPAGNTFGRSATGGPQGEPTYDVQTTVSGQLRIAFKASGTFSVAADEKYNVSFYLKSSVVIPSSNIEVNFLTPSAYVMFPIGNVSTGWNRYSAVVTVPAGATTLNSAQLISPGAVASGASFSMTKVQITKGETLYNFADGSSPGWVWNGPEGASTSTGSPQ